jgi:UDP-N-acetylmuramate--alanine ligase
MGEAMKHAIKHVHFVGIGGSGMSPIAEILHRLGFIVSGSDQTDSSVTQRLADLGLSVFIGHDASHVAGAQAVVTSSAVKADNPEVVAAREARIPVVPRAVLLAELMRRKLGIAIAGTHGKTTTTSLTASLLAEAGVDPTYVIGGQLLSAGSNARLGAGEHIVVEADESDASFLHLSPVISVVTNIDADHMDTYGHSLDRLHTAFVDFLHRLPFYGRAVLCSDDAGVRAVLPRVERPVTTYGLEPGADLRAVQVQALDGGRMAFVAQQVGYANLPITLNLAGVHNVRNALAALAVARELELHDNSAQRAFDRFAGVGRRFQRRGELPVESGGKEPGTFTLVDDYGHHPVELAAVINAARGAFPGRRLLVAFQPHRYTRTRDCFADFVTVLRQADVVLLTEVYAAGEARIEGADGQSLARAAGASVQLVPQVADLAEAVHRAARAGDVVITMGAGSIGAVAGQIRQLCQLSQSSESHQSSPSNQEEGPA